MAEQHQRPSEAIKTRLLSENGPSTSQVVAVVTLFPFGAALLCLAALTLAGTLIGLAFSAPLFLIFSPVIVPAILGVALTVAGFLTSGVFGLTALSSVSWIISYFRRMRGSWAEQIDQARWRVEDTAGHVGQRTRATA